MIGIKKVEVTPVDVNYGKIINSDSTTDDKTKNTYSMQVIDNKIEQSQISLADYMTEVIINGTGSTVTENLPNGWTYDECSIISVMRNQTGVSLWWSYVVGSGTEIISLNTDNQIVIQDSKSGFQYRIILVYGYGRG